METLVPSCRSLTDARVPKKLLNLIILTVPTNINSSSSKEKYAYLFLIYILYLPIYKKQYIYSSLYKRANEATF